MVWCFTHAELNINQAKLFFVGAFIKKTIETWWFEMKKKISNLLTHQQPEMIGEKILDGKMGKTMDKTMFSCWLFFISLFRSNIFYYTD